ncbi:MAG: zinc-binding alcohol dehydrogenase family protein [Nevskia sp.]|nr:zinc-binding alcohol dehydrogenase family protein [Nevskia sp.]
MKAVGLLKYLPITHAESLLDIELPKPQPKGRDLLVAVKAVAVNPVDTKVRAPKDKVEAAPRVLGWDAAGIVESVGPDVTLFKPGDAVFYAGDVTRQGSNSEFQLVDERIVGRKPSNLGFAEAAALPLTAITAWEGLFDRLHISAEGTDKSKSLLIVGGAGGVGSIAIQIAKRVASLRVITTASRPETITWCRELGADEVVDHRGDLAANLKAKGIGLVDYILCCNDTDQHFPALAKVIAPQGTICTIVENARPLPVELLKSKSAAFAWEFMFARSMFQTPDMIEQHHLLNRVAGLIEAGTLRTTLKGVLGPINAATLKEAHAELESGKAIGKLVLEGF